MAQGRGRGCWDSRTIVKALYVEDFAKTEAFAEVMDEAPWRR